MQAADNRSQPDVVILGGNRWGSPALFYQGGRDLRRRLLRGRRKERKALPDLTAPLVARETASELDGGVLGRDRARRELPERPQDRAPELEPADARAPGTDARR